MSKDLLGTLQRFNLVIDEQSKDILDWVRDEVKSEDPDPIGISQRLGFLAATQAYLKIAEYYMEDWDFVSEEDFGRAIQIAGDSFRSYIADAHIIPNSASWFEGVKGQLVDKLQQQMSKETFFDQALEKSLEEYNEVLDTEIRTGFDIAFNFIRELSPDDLEITLSAEFEQTIKEQAEEAEKKGSQVLSKLLNRLGFGPK